MMPSSARKRQRDVATNKMLPTLTPSKRVNQVVQPQSAIKLSNIVVPASACASSANKENGAVAQQPAADSRAGAAASASGSASNILISVRVKPSEAGQRDGFAEGRGAITDGKRIEMVTEMGTASGGSSSSSVASGGTVDLSATTSGRTVVKAFQPNYVFGQEADQQNVYESAARELVLGILTGRNASLIAYGQTGSGKTHTMLGEPRCDSDAAGIIPRALLDLFQRMEAIRTEEGSRPGVVSVVTELRASYVEIYQEQPYDLLALHAEAEDAAQPSRSLSTTRRGLATAASSRPIVDEPRKILKVRESDEAFFLEDCKQVLLRSPSHALEVLNTGFDLRRTASTAMNARSSRSHAILSLAAEVRTTVLEAGAERAIVRSGVLDVVDLAGSERQRDTGAEGSVIREAGKINQSLGALADVIKCSVDNTVAKNSRMIKPVPWRNSKLTMLLKRSLSGNSRTAMIFTISPALDYWSESLATLSFADRARKMQTEPTTNERTLVSGSVAAMATEIAALKAQLAQAQAYRQAAPAPPAMSMPIQSTVPDDAGYAARRIEFGSALSSTDGLTVLSPDVRRHVQALSSAAELLQSLYATSADAGVMADVATPDMAAVDSRVAELVAAGDSLDHITTSLTARLVEVSSMLVDKVAETDSSSKLLDRAGAALSACSTEDAEEVRASKRSRTAGAADVSSGAATKYVEPETEAAAPAATSLKARLAKMGAVALPGFALPTAAAPPVAPASPEVDTAASTSSAAVMQPAAPREQSTGMISQLAGWRDKLVADIQEPIARVAAANAQKEAATQEYRSAGVALSGKYSHAKLSAAKVDSMLAALQHGELLRSAADMFAALLQDRRVLQARLEGLQTQVQSGGSLASSSCMQQPFANAEAALADEEVMPGTMMAESGNDVSYSAGGSAAMEVKPREPKLLRDTHFLRLFNQGAAQVDRSTRISLLNPREQPDADMRRCSSASAAEASVTASRSDSLSSVDREAMLLAVEHEPEAAADCGAADFDGQDEEDDDNLLAHGSVSARQSFVSQAPSTLSIGTSISARIEREVAAIAAVVPTPVAAPPPAVAVRPVVDAPAPVAMPQSAIKAAQPKPTAKTLASFIKTATAK